MRSTTAPALLAVTLLSSTVVSTQGRVAEQPEQKVTPPQATYFMGATTGSGMLAMSGMGHSGQPSLGDMFKLGAGKMPTESRALELKLGSALAPKGAPEAFHTMPAEAQVNKPIFLQTPEPTRGVTEKGDGWQPKGRITFYWGCGEKAGPGQPVVLTFDKLLNGENDPDQQTLQAAVSARAVRKPSVSTSKTYGEWPHADRLNRNKDLRASFPPRATLAGAHAIESTYALKIDFVLPGDKTFMDAVRYTSSGVRPSGAIALSWNAVARATGYSIGVLAPEGADDDDDDIGFVMWSSADRPATFIQNEHLTPAEVRRLIGLKAVLPPTTTACAIPVEVVKATKEGSTLMFAAFGDEATFIYPPRPADPATTWDQEWFARVSFASKRMDTISPKGVQDVTAVRDADETDDTDDSRDDAPSPPSGTNKTPATTSDEEYCKNLEAERSKRPSLGGVIGGRLPGRFGRMLGGRNKPDAEPADPRCAQK